MLGLGNILGGVMNLGQVQRPSASMTNAQANLTAARNAPLVAALQDRDKARAQAQGQIGVAEIQKMANEMASMAQLQQALLQGQAANKQADAGMVQAQGQSRYMDNAPLLGLAGQVFGPGPVGNTPEQTAMGADFIQRALSRFAPSGQDSPFGPPPDFSTQPPPLQQPQESPQPSPRVSPRQRIGQGMSGLMRAFGRGMIGY